MELVLSSTTGSLQLKKKRRQRDKHNRGGREVFHKAL
jgi:hypothetical protein